MSDNIKELVKRLQRIQVGMANEEEDAVLAAIAALEALAGEAERLTNEVAKERGNADQNSMQRDKARAERDRLKAALSAIAVKAGTSECGGNYVAAVSLIGDLEQMADAALRAAGDGR